MRPLRNIKDLRREGREMHNCVAGDERSVVKGASWVLTEYLGHANTRLPSTDKDAIIRELARCFGAQGLLACRGHCLLRFRDRLHLGCIPPGRQRSAS